MEDLGGEEEAVAVIRPEDLEVVDEAKSLPYALSGRVIFTMYLGHSRQAIVDIGGGARISIIVSPRIQYSPDDILIYRIGDWRYLLQE
jgi:ABC-type Fe3+/spermidine/putrescine transport system ATPase subunit